MEHLMMDVMYHAPGNSALRDILITGEMVKAQLAQPGALLKMLLKK
jgi:ATP-dependent protease Clp ATPase subunit